MPLGSCRLSRNTQNEPVNIWQKLSGVMGILIFIAAILAVIVWYTPLFEQNERMRKESHSLQVQIRREEEATRQLETNIKSLKEPKMIERMAREKLGFAKTGETVIYFQEKQTNPAVVLPTR